MKKIVCILLILTSMGMSACSREPVFSNHTSIQPGNVHTGNQSDNQTSKNPQTSGTESAPPPISNPGGDYPSVPAPADGGASLMIFHEKNGLPSGAAIYDCVNHYQPDLFTVSDLSKEVLDEIVGNTQGYQVIGEPCDDGGSYQAIFYRENRLESAKSATVWLTGTPGEKSRLADEGSYDICTYALFKDQQSGKSFAVFQASLSESASVREQEIVYLYTKYACYKDYFPTILVGDLANGDNEVLTQGGGLTKRADNLYSACMECGVTPIQQGETDLATYSNLEPGQTPYTLDLSKKLTALTFDDGPRIDKTAHAYTESVLKTLAEHGYKATFFVVGNRLASSAQAELLQQEFAAGHEIGNHTYDHTSYTQFTADELMANLEQTDAKVRQLTGGIPTLLLRAPGGNNKTDAPLKYPLVNWTVDTEDWRSTATPDSVLATAKKQLSDGGIILMHDLHKNSPDILDDMLKWLEESGYQPVTVSELFEFSDIQMDSNHAYYSVSRIKSR